MAIFGLEILMSKLSELSELVRAMGYECDVIAVTDGLPRAQFYLRESNEPDITVYDTVQISFIPPEDDSFSHFIINAVTELDAAGQDYSALQASCDVFNLATTSGFACLSGNMEKLVYRAVLPEVGMPVAPEVMDFFIKSYVEGFLALRQLISRAS